MKRLHSLREEQITAVQKDLQLLAGGATLYYVLDSYEIVQLCFPIDPYEVREVDLEAIADHQAAFHEIIYERHPLLMPGYAEEVDRHLHYLESSADQAFQETEILGAIIREGRLPEYSGMSADEKVTAFETQFNVFLTVVLGIYSIGISRLREIVSSSLITERDLPAEVLRNVPVADVSAGLAATIEACLVRYFEDSGLTRYALRRKKRTAATDARAVAWLLAVDGALEAAYLRGELAKRVVLLYVSSAPRTDQIFQLPQVRQRLPRIDGVPFSPWRNTPQMLTHLVAKGMVADAPGGAPDTERMIQKLDELKRAFLALKIRDLQQALSARAGDDCPQCILEGGSPGSSTSCPYFQFCVTILEFESAIQQRREAISNLALLSAVASYWRLARQPPRAHDYDGYLTAFRQVCDGRTFTDLALKRIQALQELVITQAHFSRRVANAVSRPYLAPLKEDRDPITSMALYLPIKPRVRLPEYQGIVQAIITYYQTPPDRFAELHHLFDFATSEYMRVESGLRALGAEHELVRCLLYLGFQRKQGDELAYEHALQMVERYPELEAEFFYVAIWSARRLRLYEQAYDWACKAVDRYPEDPRFRHGRSLVSYAWFADRERSSDWRLDAQQVIDDLQAAIKSYCSVDRSGYGQLIAAAHCNMAYFQCIEGPQWAKVYNVERARKDLNLLKEYVTPEDWHPLYPEYFHAEAMVNFHEYLKAVGSGGKEVAEKNLGEAQRCNNIAIDLFPKPSFIALRERIQRALGEMGA